MDIKVLEIAEWSTPASIYHVAQVGSHRIAKHTFFPGFYPYHGMDGYTIFSVKKEIVTTTLLEQTPNRLHWREWMVDSPTDYRAMQKYAEVAYGKVLTAGLGLGLLVHELCKNPCVESITVVEKSSSIVDLIKNYLPDDSRIHIELGDIWSFIAFDNSLWDYIIMDIWVYYGLEQQLEMFKGEIIPANKRLKAKYPQANIVFHGFAGMPNLSELEEVARQGNETNPLVIDPLIYGLQEKEPILLEVK